MMQGEITLDPRLLDAIGDKLADPWWRLTSGVLYKIMTKDDPSQPGAVMPFIPYPEQIEFLEGMWYRNLILKDRQRGFCLDPDTRILTADLDWIAIADARLGQEIVSVDEHAPKGRGMARSLRRGVVQGTFAMEAMRYRITLCDGRTLVCTDRHPWLTRKVATDTSWRSISGEGKAVTGKITVGTRIRAITLPWTRGNYEDGWFGGLLDGEGSLRNDSPAINVCQRPGAVFDRARAYLERGGYTYRIDDDRGTRPSKFGATPVPKLCLSRSDEIIRLVGQTRPARFVDRDWWEGKTLPGKRSEAKVWFTVVEIEPIGVGPVIDLQTSTSTYIAEGFVSHNTTAGVLYLLDHALFVPDQRCGFIAHTEPDARAIFRDKAKFAYDNLPDALRERMPLKRDSAEELLLAHNNSSLRVSTSMRSATIHRLHVSEMGKIAAKFPDRAKEIASGALPAVPLHGVATIESTAEGASGVFHKWATEAQAKWESAVELSPRDFKFFFSAWWTSTEHRVDPALVRVSPKEHEYFDGIEGSKLFLERMGAGAKISPEARAWYIATRDGQCFGDQALMWREYPSSPEECWQQSAEGAYYSKELAQARVKGRIRPTLPIATGVGCNTWWDLGSRDGVAIWVHQHVHPEHRFIRFVEGWEEPFSTYVKRLDDIAERDNLVWGIHYLPHDALQERQGETELWSPLLLLQRLKPTWRFQIVPRVNELRDGINAVRQVFNECWFDESETKEGIVHLGSYRKRRNTATGYWMEEPIKDEHTEAADAFRQFAQAHHIFKSSSGQGMRRPNRSRT